MQELLLRKQCGFELSVTLNFNRETTLTAARNKLKALAQRIDNFYLGHKWQDNESLRTFFVAFAENRSTNLHYHLLLRLPYVPWSRLRQRKFRGCRRTAFHSEIITGLWKELMPSGSCDVRRIYDLDGIARYDTKQLLHPGYEESFIISTEFHEGSRSAPGVR